MADFKSQHRVRMTDPTPISKSKLERGMVAKVRYKKVSGDIEEYFVFVLQPKYMDYFHCIDLKHIKPNVFEKLAEEYPEIKSTSSKVKKLDLTKLQINESSKQFYMAEIKRKKLSEGYRTFVERNITFIIVFNYKYGKFDRIAPEQEREQID